MAKEVQNSWSGELRKLLKILMNFLTEYSITRMSLPCSILSFVFQLWNFFFYLQHFVSYRLEGVLVSLMRRFWALLSFLMMNLLWTISAGWLALWFIWYFNWMHLHQIQIDSMCFLGDIVWEHFLFLLCFAVLRPRLVNMCKYVGISPFGTDAYLHFMLRKRLQWQDTFNLFVVTNIFVASFS